MPVVVVERMERACRVKDRAPPGTRIAPSAACARPDGVLDRRPASRPAPGTHPASGRSRRTWSARRQPTACPRIRRLPHRRCRPACMWPVEASRGSCARPCDGGGATPADATQGDATRLARPSLQSAPAGSPPPPRPPSARQRKPTGLLLIAGAHREMPMSLGLQTGAADVRETRAHARRLSPSRSGAWRRKGAPATDRMPWLSPVFGFAASRVRCGQSAPHLRDLGMVGVQHRDR